MARLIHGVAVSTPSVRPSDPLTDLTRLLSRLQHTVLRADADRELRLRTSEYEREKVQTNIKFARSLLTKLEHQALGVKIHSRKQDLQTDLLQKRDILDQLAERMADLAEIAAADGDDDNGQGGDYTSEEGEDILADIIATPSESLDSTRSPDALHPEDADEDPDPDQGEEEGAHPDPIPDIPKSPPSQTRPREDQRRDQARRESSVAAKPDMTATGTATSTQPVLRSRRQESMSASGSSQAKTTALATGSSSSSALFGGRVRGSGTTTTTATTEAILDHQRAEHDVLSESILRLASDLKASSQALSASLDEDKDVVARAGDGMHKTGAGMDAVTRKMGTLQRLTEGEGWWGRMRLYAQIYGLMVVLVLVVFVLPKLRF
ncbi:synaptobrevin [Lasiosphaeria ovina]|uniref:Synaptobrevin n=1 Tax=Lasiosphaeria ovina TaxID=92902 RepID=A0AAE0TUM8_9PEZI|nr:synaptobrevin [Lasiosphaeria ovina]